jgi:hypothetical protein
MKHLTDEQVNLLRDVLLDCIPSDTAKYDEALAILRNLPDSGEPVAVAMPTTWKEPTLSGKSIEVCSADDVREIFAAMHSELSKLQIQLAACGVGAMKNTESSKADRLNTGCYGYSESYADVCRAVDREIEIRAALLATLKECGELRAKLAAPQPQQAKEPSWKNADAGLYGPEYQDQQVPREDTEEANDAIRAMLKEYNYPANPNNAARAGYRACRLIAQQEKA